MSRVVNPAVNLTQGASYRTTFSPGKTGLIFEKGKPLRKNRGLQMEFEVAINSALVSNNQLLVTWSVVNYNDQFYTDLATIDDGNMLIRNHFESKNTKESFSTLSIESLTEGATPPTSLGDGIKNIAKDAAGAVDKLIPDLDDLSSKIGIALIVLAVSLGLFAAYKAFSGPSSSKAGM